MRHSWVKAHPEPRPLEMSPCAARPPIKGSAAKLST
jgi:hypothetical protein